MGIKRYKLSGTYESDPDGILVEYADHLADKAAALAEKDEPRLCGGCRHWKPTDSGWGECEPLWDVIKVLTDGAEIDDLETPEGFGCIRWEAACAGD